MKPEQKAKELITKMHLFSSGDSGKDDLTKANAKQCALICADEVMKRVPYLRHENPTIYRLDTVDYWEEVKKEINKL